MSMEDAAKILNELSFVMVTFDQSSSNFRLLIARIKELMEIQDGLGSQDVYPLLEGL
jgi:hypothetical protein